MSVNEEEILEEISGYLHGYLKGGKLRIDSFLSKMNVNISNLDQLLTVRFLLKPDTKNFIRELPTLLQRFKTTTTLKTEMNIGEVRGQINWEQTIKERFSRNHRDRTIFSTNESIRSYNIPENIVLKEFLGLLYKFLFQDSYLKGFEQAEWFSEWIELKENVAQAYKKNIYLQRVEEQTVPNRTVQKVLTHRNKLYREAARLLLTYRQIISGDFSEEDMKVLLRETFIAPDHVDVLFELYWIIRLIREETDESQLYLMDGSHSMVASWEKESFIYHLYHDSVGSDEVQFRVHVNELAESNNSYLKQKYRSFTKSNDIAHSLFGRIPNQMFWRGRPDFLIEIYDKGSNSLVKVILGEVKNTNRTEYAITGLEELLDYMYLVKDRKGNYIMESDVEVQGVLCLGNVPMVGGSSVDERVRVMRYFSRR